ncbi:MAG: hypothetical protein R3313_04670, partial [Candidatus Saccharimonadales bacterium]|nr:hypothetical protein [Candidatus Saccharimonadales bacterium]
MIETIGENPLFLSAVRLIVGQRLVRVLDDNKQAYQPDANLQAEISTILSSLPEGYPVPPLDNLQLYKAVESDASPFGYKGRAMISEQLHMTPEVQQLIRKGGFQTSASMIEDLAINQGMVTMLQDGILKAIQGITTIEEVYRVVD